MKSKSRAQALQKAYREHQAAIQSAINTRRAILAASEVVTLRSGVQLVIKHGEQGYQVAGVLS